MKGVNAIENTNDPGKDGIEPSSGTNPNRWFAKDLTAFSLEYFNNDYKAINQTVPFANVDQFSHAASNSSALYNGNIRYMQTRLTNPTTEAEMPMLNAYKYDQLNRLKESRSFENGLSANVWNPVSYNNEYFNSFNFDEMGNIENQIRYSRNGTLIDNLTYHYQKSGGKLVRNRLYHLNDAQTDNAAFTDDIDNMLTFNSTVEEINVFNNYNYDEEGRLVKDSSERISKIVWRVDGKVKEIQREQGEGKWLKFDYDAMGHRIAKHVYANNSSTLERSTYYILDAQGNQISTYDHEVVSETAQFNLKERNIFGSSRIGSKQDSLNVLTATLSQNITQILGTKYYEFSNHLGNVLTVYNDIKIPLDADADYVVEGFRVPIRNIADYSPFGVQLDGRTISMDSYRYGYQGSEKDDEISGNGNSYSAEFWQYDSRLGRRWNIDPVFKEHESPYACFANNPICMVDINGADTSFADPQVAKTFNDAYDKVQKKLNDLDSKIKTLNSQLATGNLDKKETKKINKELSSAQTSFSNWSKLNSDFEEIIKSPVLFIYTSEVSGLRPDENGLTNWNEKSSISEDGNGNVTGGKIYIAIRPGETSQYSLIHENRHGIQIKNNIDIKNTFSVESEAYRYQEIFDPASVQRQIDAVKKAKYGHLQESERPNVSFDQMIKYLYNIP